MASTVVLYRAAICHRESPDATVCVAWPDELASDTGVTVAPAARVGTRVARGVAVMTTSGVDCAVCLDVSTVGTEVGTREEVAVGIEVGSGAIARWVAGSLDPVGLAS